MYLLDRREKKIETKTSIAPWNNEIYKVVKDYSSWILHTVCRHVKNAAERISKVNAEEWTNCGWNMLMEAQKSFRQISFEHEEKFIPNPDGETRSERGNGKVFHKLWGKQEEGF